jgi:hypothetical protein
MKSHGQYLSVISCKLVQAAAISDYDHYEIARAVAISDYDHYEIARAVAI